MSSRPFKEHVIDLDDMLQYIYDRANDWERYASDGWKRLDFRCAGGYRVTVSGVITYEGADGSSAVHAYNEAKRLRPDR